MTPFLYTRSNPHAPWRANEMRGWYYPTRLQTIRLIVLHTGESDPSPASAENVSRWQRDTAAVPSSYHVNIDSDSDVTLLPDEATAFHCVGFNSMSLGMSWATRAAWWGRYPGWDIPAIERGAQWAAAKCLTHGIPPRLITRAQAAAGSWGFARHSDLDPARRSDPGSRFPMAVFMARVAQLVDGAPDQEDDMTPEQAQQLDDLTRSVARIEASLEGRRIGDDLARLRRSVRALGTKLGVPVASDLEPSGKIDA